MSEPTVFAAATLAGQLTELVYTLRARAGLTQTELARRMRTTQSSIARVESGGSLPTSTCWPASPTPPALSVSRRPRDHRRRPRRSRLTRSLCQAAGPT
jgi:Helix-turn-helix domain